MSSPDLTYSYAVTERVYCLHPKLVQPYQKPIQKCLYVNVLVNTIVKLLSLIRGHFIFSLKFSILNPRFLRPLFSSCNHALAYLSWVFYFYEVILIKMIWS
jgi:hypothetical protein